MVRGVEGHGPIVTKRAHRVHFAAVSVAGCTAWLHCAQAERTAVIFITIPARATRTLQIKTVSEEGGEAADGSAIADDLAVAGQIRFAAVVPAVNTDPEVVQESVISAG